MIMPHSESVGTDGMAAPMVRIALAGTMLLPLLVWSAFTARVLLYVPGAAAVTFATTVQLPVPEPPPGIALPADNVTEPPPAMAVTTPPQVVLAFGLAATTTPGGNESTSGVVSVAAAALELVKVIVRVEIPPGPLRDGLKALAVPTPPGGGTAAQKAALTVFCRPASPRQVSWSTVGLPALH